jgi:hypothetical protein
MNPHTPVRCALRICVCALIGATAAVAQPSDSTELIKQLMQRIDQLEKRVAELEGQKKPLIAVPPVAESAVPSHHEAPPILEGATSPAMKITGFGDLVYMASDRPAVNTGFTEGQFILHIASALSPKVTYFGELSFTARPDAGLGSPSATGFNAEVERTIIRYDYNDRLKVSFGRYHTPVNYWNTAYHHGAWLQTTISRPEMTQFGGSFIPVHFVGSLIEGAVPAGGLNLNYNVGLGNGRSGVISRGGDWGDLNNHKAWLANVFVRPDGLYGLQVGGSLYRDKVNQVGALPTREWIQSAHFAWTKETPEIIAEFANVRHRTIGATSHNNSHAWYVQGAYRLPFQERKWKPYYRYESITIPRADQVFALIPGLRGSTAGLRYDLTNFSALKLEYRNIKRPALPRYNGLVLQTSFTF